MMSDLLKISLTFLIILFLLRKKIPIGYVMLIASANLYVLYRMNFAGIYETVKKTAINEATIKLFLALSLIRMFESILRENDILSTMMSSVRGFFGSRKIVIISMPVLIGMLPSLGGAYFSAPMVKEATSGLTMTQEEKAFINYWFRHPWEYILPLYPGILLASAISNIPLHNLIAANLAYAAVLVITGFVYSMRGIGKKASSMTAGGRSAHTRSVELKKVLSFTPFLAVLVLVVAVRMELHAALLLIIFALFLLYRYGTRDIARIIKHGFAPDVAVLIFGVMLFKETMEVSGAVRNLSAFFLEQGIPALPIICFLPFLSGMLTGLTVGFVGSTLPLLISISGKASLAPISLAFAAGFLGVLLSPVHICLVLTREYFKADLWGVYKMILPASAFIFLTAIAEYVILR